MLSGEAIVVCCEVEFDSGWVVVGLVQADKIKTAGRTKSSSFVI
jgi:hypothetical protein